jgi:acetyltransferase-like isoleucine patch superfamily enzyme
MERSSISRNSGFFDCGENCKLSDSVLYSKYVSIGNNCSIGENVKIGFNTQIKDNVIIGDGVSIGNNVVIFDDVVIGNETVIENSVELGYNNMTKVKGYYKDSPTLIGEACLLRTGSIIYRTTKLGDRSWIGNYAIIRENTTIGQDTTIGSHVMCEGYTRIGDNTRIYSFCELGGNMIIGNFVFIGPGTVTANNPKPLIGTIKEPTTERWNNGERRVADKGPHILDGAKIGISSTLLAEIVIGKDALIGAGSVVTKSVPNFTIVRGVPAREVGVVSIHERLK